MGLVGLIVCACSAPPGGTNSAPDARIEPAPDGGTGGISGAAGISGVAGASGAPGTGGAAGVLGASGASGNSGRLIAPATRFAAAATDDTLAVTYYEPGTTPQGTSAGELRLQLFDEALEPRGAPFELDRETVGGSASLPTVATDGADFVACWSRDGQARCFRAGQNGASGLLFQTSGVTPAVAFHPPSWAVAVVVPAERTSTAELQVTRLAPEGVPVGDPATFPYDGYFARPPSFVSTPSGFALLAGSVTVHLYRLSGDLGVVGAPLDMGFMPWSSDALAATDDEAAMSLAIPYGHVLIRVRGDDVVLRQNRSCCGKTGGSAAVAVAGSTFAVGWRSTDGGVVLFEDIEAANMQAGEPVLDEKPLAVVAFRSRLVIVAPEPP